MEEKEMLLSLSDYPTWDGETIDEVSEEAETNETVSEVKTEEATKDVDLTEMEERLAKRIHDSLVERFEAKLAMEKAKHKEQIRNLEEQSALKDARIKQLEENNSKQSRRKTEQFREQIPAFWKEQKAKRQAEVANKRSDRQRPWDSAGEVVLDGVIERINNLQRVQSPISLKQSELLASLLDETMRKVYFLCEMTSSLGIEAYRGYLVASKKSLKKEIELMEQFKNEDKKCNTSNIVGVLCEELSRTCKLASMRMEEAAETIKNMGDEDGE